MSKCTAKIPNFFYLYQGKTYKGDEAMEQRFGKCSATVLHLLHQYKEKADLPHFYG